MQPEVIRLNNAEDSLCEVYAQGGTREGGDRGTETVGPHRAEAVSHHGLGFLRTAGLWQRTAGEGRQSLAARQRNRKERQWHSPGGASGLLRLEAWTHTGPTKRDDMHVRQTGLSISLVPRPRTCRARWSSPASAARQPAAVVTSSCWDSDPKLLWDLKQRGNFSMRSSRKRGDAAHLCERCPPRPSARRPRAAGCGGRRACGGQSGPAARPRGAWRRSRRPVARPGGAGAQLSDVYTRRPGSCPSTCGTEETVRLVRSAMARHLFGAVDREWGNQKCGPVPSSLSSLSLCCSVHNCSM